MIVNDLHLHGGVVPSHRTGEGCVRLLIGLTLADVKSASGCEFLPKGVVCPHRAFDTLAKALNPGDGSAGDSLEATMQLMSGDQSGPVVELEGPLLSDSHVPFKVRSIQTQTFPFHKMALMFVKKKWITAQMSEKRSTKPTVIPF